jgi:hypothetical protein
MVNYSFAMGLGAQARAGFLTQLFGFNTIANGFTSFVIGLFNDTIIVESGANFSYKHYAIIYHWKWN